MALSLPEDCSMPASDRQFTTTFPGYRGPDGRVGVRNHVVVLPVDDISNRAAEMVAPVSYTPLRAHETVLDLVCRLLLEKKKQTATLTRDIQEYPKHYTQRALMNSTHQ